MRRKAKDDAIEKWTRRHCCINLSRWNFPLYGPETSICNCHSRCVFHSPCVPFPTIPWWVGNQKSLRLQTFFLLSLCLPFSLIRPSWYLSISIRATHYSLLHPLPHPVAPLHPTPGPDDLSLALSYCVGSPINHWRVGLPAKLPNNLNRTSHHRPPLPVHTTQSHQPTKKLPINTAFTSHGKTH